MSRPTIYRISHIEPQWVVSGRGRRGNRSTTGTGNWTFHLTQSGGQRLLALHTPALTPLVHPHTIHSSRVAFLLLCHPNNTPTQYLSPDSSRFSECLFPTCPNGCPTTPAGLCSVNLPQTSYLKLQTTHPTWSFLYSMFWHLAFCAFHFFWWLLISPPGIYAHLGQGLCVTCSLLHLQLFYMSA